MTVGELTSSIAHEINQPLAAIVMNGNACLRWLALDPPDVARARSSAELIIRDGDRASQVISRIRALLKKTPSAKSTLDVGELVREVIALTRHEVTRNKVILRTDLEPDLPHVSGDRIQLQQVMINLTVNAVDAMRGVKDGRRELLIAAVKECGVGVRVTVSDTGGGVAAAIRWMSASNLEFQGRLGHMGLGDRNERLIMKNTKLMLVLLFLMTGTLMAQ